MQSVCLSFNLMYFWEDYIAEKTGYIYTNTLLMQFQISCLFLWLWCNIILSQWNDCSAPELKGFVRSIILLSYYRNYCNFFYRSSGLHCTGLWGTAGESCLAYWSTRKTDRRSLAIIQPPGQTHYHQQGAQNNILSEAKYIWSISYNFIIFCTVGRYTGAP